MNRNLRHAEVAVPVHVGCANTCSTGIRIGCDIMMTQQSVLVTYFGMQLSMDQLGGIPRRAVSNTQYS